MFVKLYKTRTKDDHKMVSQGCNKIRRSESLKCITQPHYAIKIALCDNIMKTCIFIILVFIEI